MIVAVGFQMKIPGTFLDEISHDNPAQNWGRDMPINFLPITRVKFFLKLKAAEHAGYSQTVTVEFTHFMSSNFCYQ